MIAATNTDIATSATFNDIANGTYVVEVSKDGYETAVATVVVNGDVTVDTTLTVVDTTVKITNIYYVDADGNEVELSGATVNQNADLVVKFSGEVDTSSVNLNNIKIYKGSVLAVIKDIAVSRDKKTVTISHATLDDAADYTLKLSGIAGANGSSVASTDVAFKTTSDFVVKTLTVNGTERTDMSNLASGSLANKDIEVTMNRSIDTTSIDTDKISLVRISSQGVTTNDKLTITDMKIKGTDAEKSKILQLTIGTNTDLINADDVYVLTIDGLKDISGNAMATDKYQFIYDQTALTLSISGPDGSTLTGTPSYYYGLTSTTKDDGTVLPGFKLTLKSTVPLKESTVDADSVKLQKVDTTGTVESYTDVAVDIRFDSTSKIVTITPKEALEREATYRVITTGDIASSYGVKTGTIVNQKFKTIDSVGPVVVSTTPETGKTGIAVDKKLEIVFQMDKASYFGTLAKGNQDNAAAFAANALDTAKTIYVYNASKGTYVSTNVSATKDTGNKTITVTIDAETLDKNTTYIVGLRGKDGSEDTARGVIEDSSGNALETTYQMQFTTEGVDAIAPTITQITNTTPKTGTVVKSGAANLDVSKVYNIEFSEKLKDPSTVGDVKIEIYNPSTQQWGAVTTWTYGKEYTATEYKDTYTYLNIAANKFTDNALTRITLTGFKDAAGNVMDQAQFLLTFGNGPELETTESTASTAIKTGSSASAAATTLTLTSNSSLSVGDFVLIALDNGNKFVTSISSVVAGGEGIGIKNALPSAAAADNAVVKLPTTVNGTTGVAKSDSIYVVLKGASAATCKVNLDTIDDTTVYLTDVDGTIIPATITSIISANDKDACVTITPKADLAADTQYRVYIDGVKDTAGNKISNKKFAFKTEADSVTPDVKFTNIENGDLFTTYDRDIAIQLTFSGDLDTTSDDNSSANVAANYVLTDGTTPISVKPVVDGKTVTLYPDTILVKNKTYTLTVADTIKVGGNALSDNDSLVNTLTFKTKDQADTTVGGSLGINKATYNSTNRLLTLTFDRPVSTTTIKEIKEDNFTLVSGAIHALVGTKAVVSSDGLTVSMIVDSDDNTQIIAGVTTIAAGVLGKEIKYAKADNEEVAFGAVAVTVEKE